MTKKDQKTQTEEFEVETLEERVAPKAFGVGAGGVDGQTVSNLDRSAWVDMVQGCGRSDYL